MRKREIKGKAREGEREIREERKERKRNERENENLRVSDYYLAVGRNHKLVLHYIHT